jgi:hypothetical protein
LAVGELANGRFSPTRLDLALNLEPEYPRLLHYRALCQL